MKTRHLLWLPLILGVPAAAAAPAALVPARSPAHSPAGEYEELEAAYEEALAAWKARLDAADGAAERRDLRKVHPVHEYWARFEALAEKGEGRAYLWLAEKVNDRGLKRDEKGPLLRRLYGALLETSAGEDWFDAVIQRVVRDARYLGDEEVERWLSSASERATAPMSKALATLKLAELLAESDDGERKARGQKLLEEYEAANILTGATALDFRATTIDGHAFKLSDYRGKAVLVDFYGFW